MRIVTDGGMDLPDDLLRDLDLEIAPLSASFGKDCYRTGEISPADFYERMRTSHVIPTTSQPSVGEVVECYRRAGQIDKNIMSFHVSSALSGTYASAQAAVQQCPDLNITLVDTRTVSADEGMQVYAAAQAIKQGLPLEAVLKRVQQVAAASRIYYTVESLTYLRKGGRIGPVQALAGSLLNLKPVILMDKTTGQNSAPWKARSFSKAMEKIADLAADQVGHGKRAWGIIVHGGEDAAVEQMRRLLRERLDMVYLGQAWIAPVLGAHVGPQTVGVAIAPAEVMEG